MPEYLFTPTSEPANSFPDYDREWLKSVGFFSAAFMVISVGYECHEYTIKIEIDGQWSLHDSLSGNSIYLITPMTKAKVLEYIAFVKGMVNQ